ARDRVARVRLSAPDRPEAILERRAGGWRLLPADVPADAEVVDDVLGTLEYLASRRRVPAAPSASSRGLATPRVTREIGGKDRTVHTLRVGAAEPLLGRTWVTLGGGFDDLVDDYAIRALDRHADDLRGHAPFAGTAAKHIVLRARGRELDLHGSPLQVDL